MDKWFKKFLTAGFFFTCIVGTALHFVYEWSGKNRIVGLIAPVNESVWEHLKLLFFPAVIWTVGGSVLLRKSVSEIFGACAAGICAGLLSVVTFFYTYTGILGTNWLPLDALTFYLGALVTFGVAGRRRKSYNSGCKIAHKGITVAIFLGIMMCFFLFTYRAPDIGLFRVP